MQNGENFDTFNLKVSTLKINKKVLFWCIAFVQPKNEWKNATKIKKMSRFKFCISYLHTGCPKRIWTILWGCFEVTGWLQVKKFNSSEKFMQTHLKVNKIFFCDIKHGFTMTFWILFSKSENYAIPMYGLKCL